MFLLSALVVALIAGALSLESGGRSGVMGLAFSMAAARVFTHTVAAGVTALLAYAAYQLVVADSANNQPVFWNVPSWWVELIMPIALSFMALRAAYSGTCPIRAPGPAATHRFTQDRGRSPPGPPAARIRPPIGASDWRLSQP